MSSKQSEFDRVVPMIKKHDQAMHGLADEYDSAMGKSRAVHEDADRLRALAAEDESARSRLAALIEELMEKLRLAGERPGCLRRIMLLTGQGWSVTGQRLCMSSSDVGLLVLDLAHPQASCLLSHH